MSVARPFRRISEADLLGVMRAEPDEWFVLDLSEHVDVTAARLYPLLPSLERQGLVTSRWTSDERPRRRAYRAVK